MEQDEVGYPFHLEPPVVIKTAETPRMAATSSATERREAADHLHAALAVPHPAIVRQKTIVVFDDVFTSGCTLNAIAKVLRTAGAAKVFGITLARAPWR
jgi:predicted amidophosphoribosyltransferase